LLPPIPATGQTNRRIKTEPMRRRTQRTFRKPPLPALTVVNMHHRPLRSPSVSETSVQCDGTIQRKNRKSHNANAKNVTMFFSGVANGFQRMSARVMISNERPSPFRTRPTMQSGNHLPFRPPIQEDTLKSEQVQVERKSFVFLLKENPRGRFLRIIEESGRVSNSIIIPCAGLREFQKLLAEMAEAADKQPSKNLP
jgi:hypothetical protein